jgi:DNA invertase Pin-like site-specific DNA recombinase
VIADLYLRKSSADRGRSVESQEAEGRLACEDEGFEVGRIFTDDNRSASRFAKKAREDYSQLVEHISAGRCELLVVWEVSRSSRDLAEFVSLLNLLRSHGVLVYVVSAARTFDPRKRGDYKTLASEGLDAADESERISERTLRGKRAARMKGRPPGPLLYGYTRHYDSSGHYVEQVPAPAQAAVVREIAEAVATGTPAARIARTLNERGVPTPKGAKWHGNQVARLVLNPAYAGRMVHEGRDVGAGAWPPLLDEPTALAVRARLTRPDRRPERGTELQHLCSGAMACGVCRHLMYTTKSNGKRAYTCVECHKVTIVAQPMDELIERLMLGRLRKKDALQHFAPPPDDRALAAAEKEVADVEAALKGHYKEAAALRLSPEGLVAVEAGLLPRLQRAKAKVSRLKTPPVLRELADVDIPAEWSNFPVRTQRALVLVFAEIIVKPAASGGRSLKSRLRKSRWRGDDRTWGEIYKDSWEAA